ncbi:hypothetical protein COV82_06330 [Candidatus Peregrinibacteria bacterium CG11_big_fil_rev_8_21_14_0_20_46_8]|nr:MAG: hypothetical protein COV82_06330 [Candidatus Peregrinibacteria bacterium CG11_big_fil_rev_8_21_14_0_20_46_8]
MIADLSVREYLGAEDTGGQTNVLATEAPETETTDPDPADTTEAEPVTEPEEVIQPKVVVAPEPSPLTPELILQAGIGEKVEEELFEGKIYKLLDITATPISDATYYEMSVENIAVASISEVVLQDEIRALQLYMLLQNKTKTFIDLTLNETNAYGDRSFYINHAKKPDEAFLTVKIKNRLYSIAYLKLYHSEVKKMIELLSA